MFRSLRPFVPFRRVSPKPSRFRRRLTAVESLEQRRVLDASGTLEGDVLTVHATDDNDLIAAYVDGAQLVVQVNQIVFSVPSELVRGLRIYAEAGSDVIRIADSVPQTTRLDGGVGDDRISGSQQRDEIQGGVGNDKLDGRGGDDLVVGDPALTDVPPVRGEGNVPGRVTEQPSITADQLEELNARFEVRDVAPADLVDRPEIEPVTPFNDVILGGAGNDSIRGELGHDFVFGGAGHDRISGGSGHDALEGGAGDDTLNGDTGNDVVFGGEGDDAINGDGGNDALIGGDGHDKIDAAVGDDWVFGDATNTWPAGANDPWAYATQYANTGRGEDSIEAGEGNDIVFAGHSNDRVSGGEGNDILVGGWGSDQLGGGAGDDLIVGDPRDRVSFEVRLDNRTQWVLKAAAGGDVAWSNSASELNLAADDLIDGGDGNDILLGMVGNDEMSGGADNDLMLGGSGHDAMRAEGGSDRVYGSAGNDLIDAGNGDDVVSGGSGDDAIQGGYGNDSLSGDDGNDQIVGDPVDIDTSLSAEALRADAVFKRAESKAVVEQYELTRGNDRISGGAGDDLIRGMLGNDRISGDEGNDQIFGGFGDDFMHGADGNDTLDGGAGRDSLFGDNGSDQLQGGAGNDYLSGGNGQDALLGGDGRDYLLGGRGTDYLEGGADTDVIQALDGEVDFICTDELDRIFADEEDDIEVC